MGVVIFMSNTSMSHQQSYNCRDNLTKKNKKQSETFITAATLKERGWTKKMIDTFLPEPDKTAPNPYYKKAPDMRLYCLKRVLTKERTKKFAEALLNAQKRKQSAAKAVETKLSKTMDYVNNLKIVIPGMEKSRLIELACQSYNEFHYYIGDYDGRTASPDSDITFLSRICTNYIRHNCTQYENDLEKMFGKTGVQEGHDMLQKKINDAIYEKYPWIIH